MEIQAAYINSITDLQSYDTYCHKLVIQLDNQSLQASRGNRAEQLSPLPEALGCKDLFLLLQCPYILSSFKKLSQTFHKELLSFHVSNIILGNEMRSI